MAAELAKALPFETPVGDDPVAPESRVAGAREG
jgi:hypothetical protein